MFNQLINKKMSVRASRPRAQTLSVTKYINGVQITLSRVDCFLQKKSILYSKMKNIESGRIKLPIPLSKIKNNCFGFNVNINGTLELSYSF